MLLKICATSGYISVQRDLDKPTTKKSDTYIPSFIRVILARKTKRGNLKHIAGGFETVNQTCEVQSDEWQQQIMPYYLYVEMDQLTINDKFSVVVRANQIESMQEVDHNECPDFVKN